MWTSIICFVSSSSAMSPLTALDWSIYREVHRSWILAISLKLQETLVKLRQTNKSHWEFIAVLFSQFYIWQVEKSKLCYKTSVRPVLHYPLNRQDILGIISIKILEKTLKRKLEQQLTLNEFLLTIFLTNGPKIRSHFASNVLHKMQNTFLNEWDLKNKLLSRQPKRFFYITPWEGSLHDDDDNGGVDDDRQANALMIPRSRRSLESSSSSWRKKPALGRTYRCFRTWRK